MNTRHRILVAATLGTFGLSGLVFAGESPWKDLQILPKNIAKDDLKKTMKAQSKALGVECEHCHEMPDTEKDTKNKKIGRSMMQLTAETNERLKKDKLESQITCMTCHVGKEKPEVPAAMKDESKNSKKKDLVKEMTSLQDDISAKYYKDAKKPEDKIRCDTCHYGKEKPEHLAKK